jgi:shikimate dehydrogenase
VPGRKALLSLLGKPSATTSVAGIIGDPVRHSISPAIHNAAYGALGLDWVYVAFEVPAGAGGAAVDAMRALGLAGLSVTMPHKGAVVERLDSLTPTARRLGVANTITRRRAPDGSDVLEGDSTDGRGFLDALRSEDGIEPAGKRCLLLGAGGAARSVALALSEAGAGSVAVTGRRPEAVKACADLAGSAGEAIPPGAGALEAAARAADLIVNASPVGMRPGDGIPFDLEPSWLRPRQSVIDLIYLPATTPLLAAARDRGAFTSNGLGMLINQAARQIEVWTGRPAPLEVMSAAALAALSHRPD